MTQTVAQYLSSWLDLRAPSLAPSTVSGYKRCLRLHIAPVAGAVPLADLSPAHIMAILAPLCAAGHTRQAQLVRILLRCALQDAVRMGLLPHNPVDAVRPPAHRKQPISFWSPKQISLFLQAQRFAPLYHAWLLALLCGLRRGELLGLRWSDVDLAAGKVDVCNQRMVIERVCIDRPPKSAAGRRQLPLPAPVLDALRRERRRSRSLYVLSHPDGTPYTPQQLRRALDAACAASGVPRLHIHGLRHSMATAALEAGADVKVLQSLLGHAHYSTTADTYLHPSDTIRAQALAGLAASVL